MNIAVIGGGWAGLAAAVQAVTDGHRVRVFEAARSIGGRARALALSLPDGRQVQADNGQHILIGAYTETLALLHRLGVDEAAVLLREPLSMRFPDGQGLSLPRLPAPLDALAGIALARGWPLRARLSLLRTALAWQSMGFRCDPALTVSQLCRSLHPWAMQALIDPLCVSALNTPASQASAQIFLRVMHDALFSVSGGSHLLLPRVDLSTLFPLRAQDWLRQHGGDLRTGTRVMSLRPCAEGWDADDERFDAVILATSPAEAARLVGQAANHGPGPMQDWRNWAATAAALAYEAITTVYAWAPSARLPSAMLALHSGPDAPAQFVFDRGRLGGPAGLLAFVVSASRGEREAVQAQVLAQARTQLRLDLTAVQTVVEKRATFACTPVVHRPAQRIAPGLLACGDYVAGPYPATLEGAVRSGLSAAGSLEAARQW